MAKGKKSKKGKKGAKGGKSKKSAGADAPVVTGHAELGVVLQMYRRRCSALGVEPHGALRRLNNDVEAGDIKEALTELRIETGVQWSTDLAKDGDGGGDDSGGSGKGAGWICSQQPSISRLHFANKAVLPALPGSAHEEGDFDIEHALAVADADAAAAEDDRVEEGNDTEQGSSGGQSDTPGATGATGAVGEAEDGSDAIEDDDDVDYGSEGEGGESRAPARGSGTEVSNQRGGASAATLARGSVSQRQSSHLTAVAKARLHGDANPSVGRDEGRARIQAQQERSALFTGFLSPSQSALPADAAFDVRTAAASAASAATSNANASWGGDLFFGEVVQKHPAPVTLAAPFTPLVKLPPLGRSPRRLRPVVPGAPTAASPSLAKAAAMRYAAANPVAPPPALLSATGAPEAAPAASESEQIAAADGLAAPAAPVATDRAVYEDYGDNDSAAPAYVDVLGAGGCRALTDALLLGASCATELPGGALRKPVPQPYTPLTKLTLCGCSIGDSGAAQLGRLLGGSGAVLGGGVAEAASAEASVAAAPLIELTVLELRDCGIGIDGACALAAAMSSSACKHLRALKLSYNRNLGCGGAAALAGGALALGALEVLDLSHCSVGGAGAKALRRVLSAGADEEQLDAVDAAFDAAQGGFDTGESVVNGDAPAKKAAKGKGKRGKGKGKKGKKGRRGSQAKLKKSGNLLKLRLLNLCGNPLGGIGVEHVARGAAASNTLCALHLGSTGAGIVADAAEVAGAEQGIVAAAAAEVAGLALQSGLAPELENEFASRLRRLQGDGSDPNSIGSGGSQSRRCRPLLRTMGGWGPRVANAMDATCALAAALQLAPALQHVDITGNMLTAKQGELLAKALGLKPEARKKKPLLTMRLDGLIPHETYQQLYRSGSKSGSKKKKKGKKGKKKKK